ncbi:restriction endonuclease subunit S [Formosa sp. PL04]|uniref:restriction endonuclease subunit S n=1 Tax=Formosa sp. PL04 TaxID=3081755 RepID=UPI0029827ED9|nr:restriction endonuclease subunit S [Formosa sp. PL04]MDW5289447.1 restriction endonuclease subunit S [Formosa sp. PL04]
MKYWKEVLEIRSGRNQKGVEDTKGKYPILGSAGKIMAYANDYICEEGTTIIGRKGTINNPMFIETKFWNVDTAFGLHALDGLNKFYLFYFCQSFDFTTLDKGSGRPSLVKSDLLKIQIPIPPLQEQQQIVAILDEAFTAIDQAKANIEKNIENAKELFQSKLNDIFSQTGDGWEEKSLGELGKVSMCKRILKKQTTPNGEIPFYKIGTFGKEANAFISKEIYDDFKSKYSFPKVGDILISASGTIGRRVIYDGMPAYFQDSNIVWIDNNEEFVTNEYLYQFYGVCDWNPSKGATISRLYNSDLRRINISYPSIVEQKQIIPKMEELGKQTMQIELNYIQKLKDLEELKKSILQKAFAGELTNKEVVV